MGYKSWPNACILKWANFLALVVSASIIGIGIWLATKHGSCERYLMPPMFIIGASIFVISLVGYIGALKHYGCLLWIYLAIYSIILLALILFTIFAFIITRNGAGYTVKSNGILYKQYQINDYSHWLQHALNKTSTWKHIMDCLLDDKYCNRLAGKFTSISELAKGENPVQSGCCRPPIQCGYPMINVTYYDLSSRIILAMNMAKTSNQKLIPKFSCISPPITSDKPLVLDHDKENTHFILNLTNCNASNLQPSKPLDSKITPKHSSILSNPNNTFISAMNALNMSNTPKLVAPSSKPRDPIKTIQSTMDAVYSSADCDLYQNSPKIKCFQCSSCKGGVAQAIKKEWQMLAGANIGLILILVALYIFGCYARQNAAQDRYIKMQKKGLEDIKQEKDSSCRDYSCETCWQAYLECCCFYCSQEVEEVEEISSPKSLCGKKKVTRPWNNEFVGLGQEGTCWCSSCSSCCRKKRKRKRELVCYDLKKINVDDLDPTLVFEKKKAMQDHDQVPYRREDDLTRLDYLEAGWPVQEESHQKCRYFPCLHLEKKKLDTKQKGRSNTSCCPSPCGDKQKGVDMKEFEKVDNPLARSKQKGKTNLSFCASPCGDKKGKIDSKEVENTNNSMALVGASSGTLVWDKPPLAPQGDLSKTAKDQPGVTPIINNPQVHDNVLFDKGSPLVTLKSEDHSDGQATQPPLVDTKTPKAKIFPQGWSWLMENSNSSNTTKNVDTKPDVQTRYVQILPEIVDTRFQFKGNEDDMKIFQKKDKKLPGRLQYKERVDHVETSLVQFAKPEIVDKRFLDRRFQLKSKDDIFQKKEENFQIIEDDVERLGAIHNKLSILQQQILQKEQILVFEDKLKEKGHLGRKEKETPLEKEQIDFLGQKIQGKGHLEHFDKKNEELAMKKNHHPFLPEVMNEKGQLQRKKEDFTIEKKQCEILQEKLSQKEKEDLYEERQKIELLQRQFILEEKEKLKIKEHEIALEKEKLELIREKVACKEKAQLEIKKEELSLQLEKTKEELAREREHVKAIQEQLHYQEKGQIEKSKVQLVLEKEQLEELRDKLNFRDQKQLKQKREGLDTEKEQLDNLKEKLYLREKEQLDNLKEKLYLREKEQLKNKKEELAYEKEQLEMQRENLSSKENMLIQWRKELLSDKEGQLQIFLGKFLDQEKYESRKGKVELPFKDPKNNSTNSNESMRDQNSQEETKCSKNIPLGTQMKTMPLERNEDYRGREINKDWLQSDCQSKACEKIARSCAPGFNDPNLRSIDYSHALKRVVQTMEENKELTEELFEIENTRPQGKLELTRTQNKAKYGILDKRQKGKQDTEGHFGKPTKKDFEMKKIKEGTCNVRPSPNQNFGQDVKGGEEARKRPWAILDDQDNYYESLDPKVHIRGTLKLDNSKFLTSNEDDNDKKQSQHETIKSNELIRQHQKALSCGQPYTRFETTCTKAKQLLSYNFDPPKKRSELGPEQKKAKKSESVCIVPSNMPPPCIVTKFEFPRWKSPCSSKVDKAECSNQQQERVERVGKHTNMDSKNSHDKTRIIAKNAKGKIEPSFERPRIKARFRFRGSLDRRAQNEILGKLKELELEDLKNRLEEKKILLEKLERVGTSKSRHQKSV